MKAFYTDHFELPLPDGHRFPMAKYRLLRERVALEPSLELVVPPAAAVAQLKLVHDAAYIDAVFAGELTRQQEKRIGFPWSPGLVERSRRSTGATIEAGAAALLDGAAVNLAGGTHHAGRQHGEGFCVFNDVAVAIRVLQQSGEIDTAVVIDCDVHQGNGTAEIFAADDSVFTFSIHGAKNFPLRKSPSDLDRALPSGTTGAEYLPVLADALRQIFEQRKPDIVFYVSGADPYFADRYGQFKLTKEELRQRDEMVFAACAEAGAPCVTVMGGGYSLNVNDIVDIHFQTVTAAARFQQP